MCDKWFLRASRPGLPTTSPMNNTFIKEFELNQGLPAPYTQ
jgi:hypothetical protein